MLDGSLDFGNALLIEINGRPIAVFDSVQKWVKYRRSNVVTTRLEDLTPGNDVSRYYCLGAFKPDEFGWILAISFVKLIEEAKKETNINGN